MVAEVALAALAGHSQYHRTERRHLSVRCGIRPLGPVPKNATIGGSFAARMGREAACVHQAIGVFGRIVPPPDPPPDFPILHPIWSATWQHSRDRKSYW